MNDSKLVSPEGSPSSFTVHNRELEFSTSSAQNISEAIVDCDFSDLSYVEVSTSAILHYCKQKVLKPYFKLLSLLGWRPLLYQATLFESNAWIKIINLSYTLFIMAFIWCGYILQYAACYRQDGFEPYADSDPDAASKPLHMNFNTETNRTSDAVHRSSYIKIDAHLKMSTYIADYMFGSASNSSFLFTGENGTHRREDLADEGRQKCRGNFFALYLIPNSLHFLAYLFVLYLMRTPESERLENLMERGFLQTSRTAGWLMAHRRLINALRSFLWVCCSWLLLSLTIHGLQVGSRSSHTKLDFTWMYASPSSAASPSTYSPKIHTLLIVLTICTLTWNDLICAAIVTSYAVHCQLNISYIINLCASIRERRLEFQEFFKKVEESRKFIDYLNNDQALGVSLLLINFGCKVSVALYGLLVSSEFSTWTVCTVSVVLLSIVFWLSLFSVPVVQGVRLTSACKELQRIGHELRSRPFGYQEAQQNDLDSLLLYTTTLNMEAKILHVPIRSSSVVIFCVFLLVIVLMLGQLGLLNI